MRSGAGVARGITPGVDVREVCLDLLQIKGVGCSMRRVGHVVFLHERNNGAQNFMERSGRPETGKAEKLLDGRNSALHIFKARRVGFLVGPELNR